MLNIRSLKQATPNLTVINIWGVSFVEDAHIEAFSSNCIQLAVLCVGYCPKVRASKTKKNFFGSDRSLRCHFVCMPIQPSATKLFRALNLITLARIYKQSLSGLQVVGEQFSN